MSGGGFAFQGFIGGGLFIRVSEGAAQGVNVFVADGQFGPASIGGEKMVLVGLQECIHIQRSNDGLAFSIRLKIGQDRFEYARSSSLFKGRQEWG